MCNCFIIQRRYRKFCEKVSTSLVHIQPKVLPPTTSAALHHSQRVYSQVQTWMGMKMTPTDWGWEVAGETLNPITTSKKPAPQSLLKVIKCRCKQDCQSKLCTCRKYGLPCTNACMHAMVLAASTRNQ